MRCLILMFMIFWPHLAIASAQGLFQYDRIDFFENTETQKKNIPPEINQHPEPIENEWAEPIISPSGMASIYVPPKEVRSFLENPNPENAKSYLEWNLGRLKKLTLAQQLLAKEAVELGYSKDTKQIIDSSPVYNSERSIGNPGIKGDYLVYFMLKGCPACTRQSKVIEDIYVHHPEIKVEGFGRGFSDKELKEFRFPVRPDTGLSEAYKINTFPSMAVFNKNNKRYLLSGYTEENKILSLFK